MSSFFNIKTATLTSHCARGAQMAVLLVNHRLSQSLRNHVSFAPVLQEEGAARSLSDPGCFERSRAQLPPTTKSTIALAFSSDRRTLASTHGDHTVKLVDVSGRGGSEGCVLAELEGHPRTPWTVKFHPTNPYLVRATWNCRSRPGLGFHWAGPFSLGGGGGGVLDHDSQILVRRWHRGA